MTWVAFIPGSPRYRPHAEDVAPVDSHHLFHFDRDWFFEETSAFFRPVEELSVAPSCFVCLEAKGP